jgi:hypothetical protein
MVERSLRMREVRGSMPLASSFFWPKKHRHSTFDLKSTDTLQVTKIGARARATARLPSCKGLNICRESPNEGMSMERADTRLT